MLLPRPSELKTRIYSERMIWVQVYVRYNKIAMWVFYKNVLRSERTSSTRSYRRLWGDNVGLFLNRDFPLFSNGFIICYIGSQFVQKVRVTLNVGMRYTQWFIHIISGNLQMFTPIHRLWVVFWMFSTAILSEKFPMP